MTETPSVSLGSPTTDPVETGAVSRSLQFGEGRPPPLPAPQMGQHTEEVLSQVLGEAGITARPLWSLIHRAPNTVFWRVGPGPCHRKKAGYMHTNGQRIPTMENAKRAAAVLPGTVIVGGSVARGDAHIESDVDFLCIVDSDDKTGISMHDDGLEVEIKKMLGLPVDVLLVDWPRGKGSC